MNNTNKKLVYIYQNKAQEMEDQSNMFEKKTVELKKKYWWKNKKFMIAGIIAAVLLVAIIVIAIIIKSV